MSDNFQRLEAIIVQIGEAVIATTDTAEKLAVQVNAIANQLQQQEQQIQQQGYQLFALGETLQTVIESQRISQQEISQLNQNLQRLIDNFNAPNASP